MHAIEIIIPSKYHEGNFIISKLTLKSGIQFRSSEDRSDEDQDGLSSKT